MYTKLFPATTALFLFLSLITHAQNTPSTGEETTVTIRTVNQKKEPVAFASVTVINRLDTTQIIKKAADSSGMVKFNLVKNSQYTVRITSINYQPIEKGISTSGNQTTFNFTAEPLGKTLETAVVTSKKPLMRQEDDKLIIDPENLVEASTSGYEVIEKTPGLFVDQDGNIYISSLTPATVQINGRNMKMSAADVATMLKSLPPNSISKIEILKTPSAKYDASSSGGIVNVILKKGVKIGMTGSVHGGAQQGAYGNQFTGFNLNNNDGKKSSTISLNYSMRNNYEKIVTNRFFAPDSVLNQNAFTTYPTKVYFASYGLSFPAGKKWDLDFGTSASLNDFDNKTSTQNAIKKLSTAQTLTDNLNTTTNDGSSFNYRIGLEGKMKIDSLGSEWSNDIFYNYTKNNSQQFFATYDNNPVLLLRGGDGTSNNRRNLYTAQSDLKLKLKKKFTFETGVKTSFLTYKSVTDYYKEQPVGNRQKDPNRTNTFNYKENINALYAQGSKTLGKDFVIKTGIRLENTNMEGKQIIPGDTTFSVNRTDLFPYIYLSKNLVKIAGFDLRAYLVYRRTITRPVYEQLNPFSKYIDEFLSEIGNPSLRPQFNQNYEANISVDERPILAVGVNETTDIFTNVVYQNGNQAFRTYDNLGKNKEWYFRGLGAIPPGGRYFFVLGAQYNHNFYQGLYENKPLAFKKGTWTFFTYQTFKIDKRSVITLNGFIRIKGQQQFYELTTFGSLNTSVNRKFLKEKLVLTLNLSDMFATNKNNFTLNQGSVNASGFRQGDTRRVGINLRYNFGIRKKEENNGMFNAEPPVGN
ncbi:MAG: outer membrane beta-barrel protein [Ferruginibacter sp.]|nr:outer membrane beta-barrel protein [Chitinophagaceae bacterium]